MGHETESEGPPAAGSADTRTGNLFATLLGRPAESDALRAFRSLSERDAVQAIVNSTEFKRKHSSPFWHYAACFDPVELMNRYAVPNPPARPGLIVNFLGVAIAPKFMPQILAPMSGEVQPVPMPANWHADIAEWGAVLRAVDLAGSSFTMAELGCGWGCWMVNSGVTAKRSGRTLQVIGVEGDLGHVAFATEACAINGIGEQEMKVHHAIASGADGHALFPVQQHSGQEWGLQAIFDATPEQRARALAAGTHTELRTMSMETVTDGRRLDLLHIDIQGAEVEVVRSSLDFLQRSVAYMVIGTHSRQIEGELMEMLLARGWKLEIERPAILDVNGGQPVVTVDGVQGWRNPAQLPSR